MVELIVDDIMSKASDHRAHVMMLKEKGGVRRIIVALGLIEAQAIVFALRGVEPERPLTHDLFTAFMKEFDIRIEHVLIDKISDGTFYARLHCVQNGVVKEIDARTSDAVALALRSGVPVYILEELLNRMCVRSENNGAISIPITAADEKTLRAAMENAVKEENYELAMKLKEEIDSRHSASPEQEETK